MTHSPMSIEGVAHKLAAEYSEALAALGGEYCRCCSHEIHRLGNEWRCSEGCRCMMMGCTKPRGID